MPYCVVVLDGRQPICVLRLVCRNSHTEHFSIFLWEFSITGTACIKIVSAEAKFLGADDWSWERNEFVSAGRLPTLQAVRMAHTVHSYYGQRSVVCWTGFQQTILDSLLESLMEESMKSETKDKQQV